MLYAFWTRDGAPERRIQMDVALQMKLGRVGGSLARVSDSGAIDRPID